MAGAFAAAGVVVAALAWALAFAFAVACASVVACVLATETVRAAEFAPAGEPGLANPARDINAARDPMTARGLIPLAGDGLERVGECEVYVGEKLYDYIDGGAPQYFEYGFHEVASQELRLRGRTYILDAYRMADPVAAFGIFSTRRPERCVRLDGFARSCYTGYQGLVADGSVLLEIQAYETSDSTEAQMSELAARSLDAGSHVAIGRADGIDSLLALLPEVGRKPESERLAMGPVSLGAALGLAAGGDFLRVVESVEKALPPVPVSPEGPRPKGSPVWLVGDYHATSAGGPRTTLLVLHHGPPPNDLLTVIRGSGLVPETAEPLARVPQAAEPLTKAPGWLVSEANGGCWMAAAWGRDLLLASSRVSADTLRGWIDQVARP